MIRLLGLYREKECSPGQHQSNDARLLELVARELARRDLDVELMTIEQVAASRSSGPDVLARDRSLIFSMCQSRAALDLLSGWERSGARIVNSPRAALNTYRNRLSRVMQRARLPFPATRLLSTARSAHQGKPAGANGFDVDGGVWLKRGDLHASISADVQWIASSEALRAALDGFATRGIATAAAQVHQPGDEIKFYGVTGGRLFHWFHTGRSNGYPVDAQALVDLACRAAGAAGLDVFGGDVIVSPAGELTLIDLNDWPSFAPCRDPAAAAIADYLTGRVHADWHPGFTQTANESAV